MKLTRPIKNSYISQRFGENKMDYQQFGMLGHGGYDLPCPNGTELRFEVSDCYGLVYKKEKDNNGGLGLDILTDDKDGIWKHRYWHLKDYCVEVGQIVGTGDLLGHCDNTGWSTGSHLHWEKKPQGKNTNGYYNLEQNNGYFGGVDFKWTDIYVKDFMDILYGQVNILTKIINLIGDFLKNRK